MLLAEIVYKLTYSFPDEEKYGLISQVRRSVVSIASNIAEGASRNSKKEFRNANGSLNQLNTQLELSKRLEFLKKEELEEAFDLINEIQKIIYTLIKKFSNI